MIVLIISVAQSISNQSAKFPEKSDRDTTLKKITLLELVTTRNIFKPYPRLSPPKLIDLEQIVYVPDLKPMQKTSIESSSMIFPRLPDLKQTVKMPDVNPIAKQPDKIEIIVEKRTAYYVRGFAVENRITVAWIEKEDSGTYKRLLAGDELFGATVTSVTLNRLTVVIKGVEKKVKLGEILVEEILKEKKVVER